MIRSLLLLALIATSVSGTGCVAHAGSAKKDEDDASRRLEARLSSVEAQVAAVRSELEQCVEALEQRFTQDEHTNGNRISELRDALLIEIAGLKQAVAAAPGNAQHEPTAPTEGGAAGSRNELVARLNDQGVALDPDKKTITVKGKMIAADMPLEFAVTTERGKTHETMVSIACAPSSLNAALIALGLMPGKPMEIKEDPTDEEKKSGFKFQLEDYDTHQMHDLWYYAPDGPRVAITVRWTDGGKTVSKPIEDLIFDQTTQKTMEPVGFAYVGSRMDRVESGEEVYVADVTGDIVATYHSYGGNAIFDTPLLQGKDDSTFFSKKDVCPPRGTPVEVVFSPIPGPASAATQGGGAAPAGESPKK